MYISQYRRNMYSYHMIEGNKRMENDKSNIETAIYYIIEIEMSIST